MSIDAFFAHGPHAVVGASRDRSKYGNRVLRAYLERGMPVVAVNPTTEGTIEGARVVASLAELPEPVHGISIITPPAVTEQVIEDAVAAGIRHVWMQPGAESPRAIARAEAAGLSVIAGGPCILVELRLRDAG